MALLRLIVIVLQGVTVQRPSTMNLSSAQLQTRANFTPSADDDAEAAFNRPVQNVAVHREQAMATQEQLYNNNLCCFLMQADARHQISTPMPTSAGNVLSSSSCSVTPVPLMRLTHH
ncbi:hypothetical protein CC78DRAFT_574680 [Lojkania enalia]|uniref:Secreted protein n=1 Tax=Lojkania enalia TaxID=147567 RepID=A0A9P4TP30_9PLEO|nr:hypothetical protein CC78DRAFT_574680 [Didymosphaeria enalia]